MGFVDILIIIVYLVGMFGVGFFARSRVESVDDFLVAGSKFGTFSLVGTIMASLVGAGMVLGVVGNVYQYGSGISWNYIGFGIGLLMFALVYAGPLRVRQKRTLAEIISGEFGRLPRFVAGIIAAVYSFSILAIGITGLSRMLVYVFGNALSSNAATVISMLVSIGLTALGGLYSVVWTDTIQFIIMVAVIVVVGPAVVLSNVSFEEINFALEQVGGTLTNPVKNVPVSYIMLSLATMILSIPGDPTVPQRALAGKNVKTVKHAFCISAIFAVVFGFVLTIIGGGAVALMPDIAQAYGTTEAAFPILIIEYFPPVLKGIAISALMAAVVSTVTSMLLVGTTHLVYDVGQSLFSSVSDDKIKATLPCAIVVAGIMITWMSLSIESISSVLYFAFSLSGAAYAVPMLFALYWKKTSKWGVTLGMLSGAVYVLAVQLLQLKAPGGDSVYMGLFLSLVMTVGASLLFPTAKDR